MTHYENFEIEDFDHLKELFTADWKEKPQADEMNWLFVGTSGVHGRYTKLDEWPQQNEFTVLVVRARMVSCGWGHITLPDREAYNWLCQRVAETVTIIEQYQLPQTDSFSDRDQLDYSNPMRFSLSQRDVDMTEFPVEVTQIDIRPSEDNMYVHWDDSP